MATHSSILAWRTLQTEEPGCSLWGHKEWVTIEQLNNSFLGVVCVEVCVLVTKLCPALCNPIGYSLPGFSVHGTLQQEYWSVLPFPSPRDLSDPGIEPKSPTLQADALLFELPKMEYYSAIKRNEIWSFVEMWMNLEIVILSEVNQIEEDKYMLWLICGILKKKKSL